MFKEKIPVFSKKKSKKKMIRNIDAKDNSNNSKNAGTFLRALIFDLKNSLQNMQETLQQLQLKKSIFF